jgi:hypothetical protein
MPRSIARLIYTAALALLALRAGQSASMTCRVAAVPQDGRQREFLAATRLPNGAVVAFLTSRLADSTPSPAQVRMTTISPAGVMGPQQDLAGIDPLFLTGLAAHGTGRVAAVWQSKEAVTSVSIFQTGFRWKRTDRQIGIQGLVAARVVAGAKGFLIAGHAMGIGALLRVNLTGAVTDRFEIRDPAFAALVDVREEPSGAMLFLAGGRSAEGKRALFVGRITPEGEIKLKQAISQDFRLEARLAEGPGNAIYTLFHELVEGKPQVVSVRIQEAISERSVTPIEPLLTTIKIGMTRGGDMIVAGFTKFDEFWLLGKQAGKTSGFEPCVPALTGGRQDTVGGFHEIAPGVLAVNHNSVIEREQRAHLRQLLKVVSVEWK